MRSILTLATAGAIFLAGCGPSDHDQTPSRTSDTAIDSSPEGPIPEPGVSTIDTPGALDRSAGDNDMGTTTTTGEISGDEMARIDAWLDANSDSLNQYGDPKETMYTGGTPLFDERTGRPVSKYEYIVRQHPDRPWN